MRYITRFVELTQDWLFLIRRQESKKAFSRVFTEIGQLPYRQISFHVVARSLTDSLPDLKPKVPIEVRSFEMRDLEFARQENLPSEANLCAHRLEHKHYGLVGCIDGQVAGYSWACPDMSLERVAFDLQPGDILATDSFTSPTFRGKGVQTQLSLSRMQMSRDLGYKRIVAYIEIHNAPSLAVWQRKIGAEVIATVEFRRTLLWRKTDYRPATELK